ncbi:Satratoxin biosynthesis SC1 cluster protein, partial [Lachnellula suecica]
REECHPWTTIANRKIHIFFTTTIVFTALATAAVGLRLVSRVFCLTNPGGDELAISGALVKYGLGHHADTLDESDFEGTLKWLWVSVLFYNLSLTLSKLSLVVQYLRIFTLFTTIFLCVPVNAFWKMNKAGARCINLTFLWFFNAATNILTDVVIILLPLPAIMALKLSTKQKIGLMIIFMLGIFGCLVSILRLRSIYTTSHSKDVPWDGVGSAIWSNIEVNVVIICASLPTIKPLVSKIFPRLLSSTKSTGLSGTARTSRSGFGNTSKSIQLHDFDLPPATETTIEARRTSKDLGNSRRKSNSGDTITVTISVLHEMESKENESERNLIFQKP